VQPPHRVIIVRRGAPQVFQAVLESLSHWPEGTVAMLDRRQAERRMISQRVTVERRKRKRRAEPDSMWYIACRPKRGGYSNGSAFAGQALPPNVNSTPLT
jgi:hypothetical protein